MSTRSAVTFVSTSHYRGDVKGADHHTVYVHHDGYPDNRGEQVLRFLRIVRDEVKDSRFRDTDVTASRFLTFMMREFQEDSIRMKEDGYTSQRLDTHWLAPISPKFANTDIVMGDIEYHYIVFCDRDQIGEDGLPPILVYNWDVRDDLFGDYTQEYVFEPEMLAEGQDLAELL
jgi:hypothetical protein